MTTGVEIQPEARPSGQKLPAKSLVPVALVHAAVFVTAAIMLPWRSSYLFSLALLGLAALHLAVAALAFSKHRLLFLRAWVALAVASLLFLLGLSISVLCSAIYLANLYTGVGPGLAAALVVFWCVAVLFTVPISWWGLVMGWSVLPRPRAFRAGGATLVLLGLIVPLGVSRSARAERVTASEQPELEARLRSVVTKHFASEDKADLKATERRRKQGAQKALSAKSLGVCKEPLDSKLTLFVSAELRRGKMHSCLQAVSVDELGQKLDAHLAKNELLGKVVKLDVVSGLHRLSSVHPLIDALKLRPGQDGVCSGSRCLMPWQLVALSAFNAHKPMAAVGDAAFGVDFTALRELLGEEDEHAELARLETRSFVAQSGSFLELGAAAQAPLPTKADIERALGLVERHVARAALAEGGFRYTLDPFSGVRDEESVNVPRHAGTTLVVCELGTRDDVAERVQKALDFLERFERKVGPLTAYSMDPNVARLGHTALPLVALLSCRGRVNKSYDEKIERAARYLLRLQRPDGSFFPELNLNTGEPSGTHQALFSGGQAVLALVLLEQWAKPAERALYKDAAERAMNYFAGPYWHKAPYDFFFVEENWHCLAARAAIGSHRNDAYERLCLDYVAFKSRLILDEGSGHRGELSGGYGFSPLFRPHNTATSGFGEALSASLSVRRARPMPTHEELRLLERVLGYLTRNQWSESSCFACAKRADTIGGFSESSSSPVLRIDYAQHAWAALGHGARELARKERSN